jgi:hypothetical protein
LRRNGVEFPGKRAPPKGIQYFVGYQPSQLDPGEKIFPRRQPLDFGVDRDRHGIQEVQSRIVGDEKRWWALGCHERFQRSRKIDDNQITTDRDLDKLPHS